MTLIHLRLNSTAFICFYNQPTTYIPSQRSLSMIKKFFAPFRTKVAEAEKNNIPMNLVETYFYLLLPYGMYYYGELVYYYITTYNRSNSHLYTLFFDIKRSIMFIFAVLPLLCIIWQFFSLRTFSSRFFIPLWCFLVVFLSYSITYYFTLDHTAYLYHACWSIPYGGIIYYFYKRKHLFNKNKNNNMPTED